jgi:molybdate transport system substrate-binding protein
MAVSVAVVFFVSLAFPFEFAPAEEVGSESRTIQVFAAASATNVIREIKSQFTKTTGIKVQTSFGSSAMLARQIANGDDADVFLSADVKWADDLTQKGFVVEKRNLLGNRLVIVMPDGSTLDVAKPEDLTSSKIAHIAIGDPQSVPAGKYAKKALEKLGLWEKLKTKFATADDVRNALTYVETGAAEAGIVYATDAANSKKVKVAAEIPDSLTGPVRYPIALLKHGEQNAAAASFYKFVQSPKSLEVFRKYGFIILDEAKSATIDSEVVNDPDSTAKHGRTGRVLLPFQLRNGSLAI